MEQMLYGVSGSCVILPMLGLVTTWIHLRRVQTNGKVTPLMSRPQDLVMIFFFLFNLSFVTYIVDIEQILIADPWDEKEVAGKWWPPQGMIRLIHWYSKNYDPIIMARPPWWKATIWVDVLFYGPYFFSLYGLSRRAFEADRSCRRFTQKIFFVFF